MTEQKLFVVDQSVCLVAPLTPLRVDSVEELIDHLLAPVLGACRRYCPLYPAISDTHVYALTALARTSAGGGGAR